MEYSVPKRNADFAIDARVRRSRSGLRQALLDLLELKPLEQITIRDIVAKAGVGYTTYFRHYPSKQALLDDLAADEVSRLCALTIPVYDAADSQAACLALCAYVGGRRVLWSALLTGAGAFVREELLRRGREASPEQTQGWMPADLAVVLAVSAIFELLAWWLRQAEPLPPDQVAEILDRIAISPARAATAG